MTATRVRPQPSTVDAHSFRMPADLRPSQPKVAVRTGTRAFLYLRISEDREGREAGVTKQDEDGRKLAERHGLSVDAVFMDNDIGASTRSTKPRPDYKRMIKLAQAGDCDWIVCYSSSRLTRRPRENEDLIELGERYGVRFLFVVSPSFDLNTADGRYIARLMGNGDARESELNGDRVERECLARARQGRPNGGERAYGFGCQCAGPHEIRKSDGSVRQHVHLTADELAAEVRVIRMLTRQVVRGQSTRSLARRLQALGVPTVRGGAWQPDKVRDVVIRVSNIGLREYKGGIMCDSDGTPVRAAWEPLVPREQWDAARAILLGTDRGAYYGNTVKHLMSGIALCYCGGGIRGGARGAYVGKTCAHIKRSRKHIDEMVLCAAVAHLEGNGVPVTRPGPATADVANRAQRIEALYPLIAELENALCGNPAPHLARVSKEKLASNLDQMLSRRVELEREQAKVIVPAVMTGVTADSFRGLSLERQRDVVRELFTVTLVQAPSTGNRFNPASVQITPRAT